MNENEIHKDLCAFVLINMNLYEFTTIGMNLCDLK
jgi:hypothetical protein